MQPTEKYYEHDAYCREAVGLSGTRIRTEHYGNILILPD